MFTSTADLLLSQINFSQHKKIPIIPIVANLISNKLLLSQIVSILRQIVVDHFGDLCEIVHITE